MSVPLGFLNGKPIFGPLCPPELPSTVPGLPPTHADLAATYNASRANFERSNDIRFTSLRPWRKPPTGLTCPASVNGWSVEEVHAAFPGKAWNGVSDCGLFEKLPLELRERVYAEAVVIRYTKDLRSKVGYSESGACREPEMLRLTSIHTSVESVMIFPGGTQDGCYGGKHRADMRSKCQDCCEDSRPCGGKAISDNMGFLLANKQIHAEVAKILYSQNHFGIVIDTAQPRRTFWNCGLEGCQSPKSPCLIAPRNIAQIKHISIVIRGHRDVWCQSLTGELTALKKELHTVVDVLLKLNVKLKTLDVRYGGVFEGKTGILLSEPFFDVPDPMDKRHTQRATLTTRDGLSVMLVRSSHGEQYYEGPMGLIIPIQHCDLFESLRKLKGRVEYCKLRGDLPTKYLDFMRAKMDKHANPSVPIKILRVLEEKAEAERMALRKAILVDMHATLKAAAEAEEGA